MEIPSGINFGGRQRLTVHGLPGGLRILDALGRDDAQIAFAGVFTGPDATLRARSLDELRVAGAPMPLTWDVFFYTVVIAEFRADYRNRWWIPYRISCTVVQDEASTVVQNAVSLGNAALSDLGMAADYASIIDMGMASQQAALIAQGATTRGTAAYAIAQYSLLAAQSQVRRSIASSETVLAGTSFAALGEPQTSAACLRAVTDAAEQLCALTSAEAFVRRAGLNLSSAST